jgi:ADP-heptose:LPS heptosyltransferase
VNKLREKFPDAEIHFLTKVEYIEILKLNPAIDKIITLKSSLKDSRKEISSNKYDLTLDIHKNFRSIYISSFNGKKVKRYRKDNFRKFLLVNFKIDLLKDAVPVYRKYLNTIGEYIIGEDHNFSVSQLNFDRSAKVTGKYIVIAPSSRHFTN